MVIIDLRTSPYRILKRGIPRVFQQQDCSYTFGAEPRTDWLEGILQIDNHGFVLAGIGLRKQRTSTWLAD